MLKLQTNSALSAKTFQKYRTRIKKAEKVLAKMKYSEYRSLPYQDVEKLLKQIQKFKTGFSDIVIIGIGGSMLGTQMLYHILGESLQQNSNATPSRETKNKSKNPINKSIPKFHFIDNIDPTFIASLGEKLSDKKKTLFIFVSKSGNTLEIVSLFKLITGGAPKWFGKNWNNHIIIITENKKGFLYKKVTENNLSSFKMPKFVGGRYSILTAAGLIPTALMGLDIRKLLQGASHVEQSDSRKSSTNTNSPNNFEQKTQINDTAKKLALLIYHLYKNKKKNTLALFPYINCFESFNKWAIQLIAESLGKNSKVGPLPISLIGAKDQHSILQLLLDGPKDKWVLFFELEKHPHDYKIDKFSFSQILKAEKTGTEKALTKKKIQNATLTLQKLDEENLGELIFTFENAVALAGILLKVNPFNQPAVELGKKITAEIL
jgi:glucose-6-phosphate isomerase